MLRDDPGLQRILDLFGRPIRTRIDPADYVDSHGKTWFGLMPNANLSVDELADYTSQKWRVYLERLSRAAEPVDPMLTLYDSSL